MQAYLKESEMKSLRSGMCMMLLRGGGNQGRQGHGVQAARWQHQGYSRKQLSGPHNTRCSLHVAVATLATSSNRNGHDMWSHMDKWSSFC